MYLFCFSKRVKSKISIKASLKNITRNISNHKIKKITNFYLIYWLINLNGKLSLILCN